MQNLLINHFINPKTELQWRLLQNQLVEKNF